MLFSRCQNEDRVCGRFLKRFKEGIERSLGQHVHLVDDVHFVGTHLGRKAHLVDKLTDVVDRVVGCGVELKNIEAVVEPLTGMDLIDSARQNARAGRLAHPARTGKQQGLGEASADHLVLKCFGNVLLAHD